MRTIYTSRLYTPYQGVTKSLEDIDLHRNVIALIEDTLQKCINIRNRIFVQESFQVSPQIIIQEVEADRRLRPSHRHPASNPAIVIRSVEILELYNACTKCLDELPEERPLGVPSIDQEQQVRVPKNHILSRGCTGSKRR